MTRKELLHIKRVLECIRDKDGYVIKALAFVEKDLKIYDSRIGQLKDQYDDYKWGGF